MSPQRVATGPLCRGPSRPPLPPPGSRSGSGPIGGRRALRACGRNGEGAAAQIVPVAQNAPDAAPLSPWGEPSRSHGWIGLPVLATWRRIQRRLAALRARGALHARRGGAARRPRLGGPAARRHGALAVVRQPGRGLHLGRAALRERDALHATPHLAAAPANRCVPVAGPDVGGGGEERRRGRCHRAREPPPSRAGPARLCRHRGEAVRLSRATQPPASHRRHPIAS